MKIILILTIILSTLLDSTSFSMSDGLEDHLSVSVEQANNDKGHSQCQGPDDRSGCKDSCGEQCHVNCHAGHSHNGLVFLNSNSFKLIERLAYKGYLFDKQIKTLKYHSKIIRPPIL